MKKYILLFSFCFFSTFIAWAQTHTVKGFVKEDQSQLPVAYSTIALYKKIDSTLVSGTVSTEKGRFRFENIPEGEYFLSVSYVGYESLNQPFVLPASSDKEVILYLKKHTVNLKEVVVQGQRKPVQFLKDKMIINVESYTPTAGKTASDLLKILPGVIADGTNLSILGKAVLIYIDGRPSHLSGSELTQYLGSLHADQIDKVEIISNPSSKYDAGQDGGILDIRLKRDATLGMNGYASLIFEIKASGLVSMPAFSINYRTR